ncbi:MAG: LCP family protein [Candidatus Peribacteria bacterium]|nr:LCP family protein [Candidatus Peribacteria bacterium]
MNDAPDLTDTIILLKANTEKKSVSMLSIPRDLYVKYP